MTLGTILMIVLILALVGAIPTWVTAAAGVMDRVAVSDSCY